MLTHHPYFNLDAFANPATDRIWNHTLYIPQGRRLLEPDGLMLPTGKILSIPKNDVNDFWSRPRQVGFASSRPEFVGNCGSLIGCAGYNNEWLIDKAPRKGIVLKLSSEWSGKSTEHRELLNLRAAIKL